MPVNPLSLRKTDSEFNLGSDWLVVCWMQKNFMLVGFLFHTALLTSVPFIVWGVLSVAGNIGDDICTSIDVAMAGGEPSMSSMPTIPCPDTAESEESLNSVFDSINEATGTINTELQGVLPGSAEIRLDLFFCAISSIAW